MTDGIGNTSYAGVFVIQVDDQTEGTSTHGLSGDEGIFKSGLTLRRNHCTQLKSREVLDVELEVLRVTERGIQRVHDEVFGTFVGESQQKLDDVVGRKIWMGKRRRKKLYLIFG